MSGCLTDHFARFVIAMVAEMDLAAFSTDHRVDGHGRPAHDPAMLVALLVYAYSRGQRSSRVIERGCIEDVAFRVIAANRQPDHCTIARFRQRHEAALGGLFGEALALCAMAGLTGVKVWPSTARRSTPMRLSARPAITSNSRSPALTDRAPGPARVAARPQPAPGRSARPRRRPGRGQHARPTRRRRDRAVKPPAPFRNSLHGNQQSLRPAARHWWQAEAEATVFKSALSGLHARDLVPMHRPYPRAACRGSAGRRCQSDSSRARR
jgi:transposase